MSPQGPGINGRSLNRSGWVGALTLIALACYPVVVFFGIQGGYPRATAGILLIVLALRAASSSYPPSKGSLGLLLVLPALLVIAAFVADDGRYLLFYPMATSLLLLGIFGLSFRFPPSIAARIARWSEPDLPAEGVRYCDRVTFVWCVFFLGNAVISGCTIASGSLEAWTLYNGCISYLLMGAVMFGELMVRKRVKRRMGLLAALTVLFSAPAAPFSSAAADSAEDPLYRIASTLAANANASTLRVDFEQQKFIAAMTRPISSSGSIVIARDLGVLWITKQPFPSTMAITAGLVIKRDEGRSRKVMRGEDDPVVKNFTFALLNVLNGDIMKLRETFHAAATLRGNEEWILELTPRDSTTKRFLKAIRIGGSNVVSSVELNEEGGDRTVITMNKHQAGPDLSVAERALFNEGE